MSSEIDLWHTKYVLPGRTDMIEWRIEIVEGEDVPSGFLQAPDSHVGKIVDKVVFVPEIWRRKG
jgi:hypothetical protein